MSTIQRLLNGLNLIVKYDESAYVGIGSETEMLNVDTKLYILG
jgi:hypothetical protein